MRILFLILISSVSLILKKEPVQHSTSVVLRPGEKAKIGAFSIGFKQVLSDSRCPKGVTCIWEGEAKVLVAIYKEGRLLGEEILTLSNTFSSISRLENYFPEMDSLIGGTLFPYPEIAQKSTTEEYSLSLQFYRK